MIVRKGKSSFGMEIRVVDEEGRSPNVPLMAWAACSATIEDSRQCRFALLKEY